MKKFLSVLLISIMLITIVSISSVSALDNSLVDVADKTVLLQKEKLIKCDATLEEDFANDSLLVVIKNKDSLELNQYNNSSFDDIEEISEVREITVNLSNKIKNDFDNKKEYIKKCLKADDTVANLNRFYSKDISILDKQTVEIADSLAQTEIEEEHPNYHQIIKINLRTKSKQAVLDTIKELEKREDIILAEPNYRVELNSTPNDTKYSDQWASNNINLPSAWDITTGSKNVLVGVMDTGIKGTHPDLSANINTELSKSFVDNKPLVDTKGHGTHVAGIIGAVGNNNKGIAGVCWDISLVSLKISIDGVDEDTDAVADAITYAQEKGIEILNLSYSSTKSGSLEYAISNYDGILICSADNDGQNIDDPDTTLKMKYPSLYTSNNIISVASIDENNSLASDSNYGSTSVDIAAPGVGIKSTYTDEDYHKLNGTSMAAPHVTGVAALIKSKYPNISYQGIRQAILGNVDKVTGLSGKVKTGGKLNAYKALSSVPTQKYTVKYNKNGGTGTSMSNTSVTYGIPISLRKNTYTINETGKTFSGWFAHRKSDDKWLYNSTNGTKWCIEGEEPTGYTKKLYADKAKIAHLSLVKDDIITMYAQWRPIKFILQFNANTGGGVDMLQQIFSYGSYQNIRKNTYGKSGYHFTGWTAHRQSDNKWLYINGSTKGWYLENQQPAGYTKYLYADQASVGKTSSVDGDIITMYAQWEINTYTLTYNGNGGTGYMPTKTGVSFEDLEIDSNTFTKDGYYFAGWNIIDNYGDWSCSNGEWRSEPASGTYVKYYTSLDYVNYISDEGGSLTAYAQWCPSYYVKGDANLDGVVDTNDITLISNYLNSATTLTNLQLFLADYNKDGYVNVGDVSAIQKIV